MPLIAWITAALSGIENLLDRLVARLGFRFIVLRFVCHDKFTPHLERWFYSERGPCAFTKLRAQGSGSLRQGFLELSNVEPVRELIDLITTQRSFEMNSQAVQAADQMLQVVSNLRKF